MHHQADTLVNAGGSVSLRDSQQIDQYLAVSHQLVRFTVFPMKTEMFIGYPLCSLAKPEALYG
jgi:hypothetical protein